jgi:ribosomal protein S27E
VERVDGNAVAGALGQFLAVECTEARGRCAACGAIAALGAAHAYMHPLAPGSVVRCASCEAVLAVVVEAGGRTRLAFAGLAWIEVSAA